MKEVPLSEIKDDLSRFLWEAETQEIIVTRHGKPAGVLIGFESEEDWFDFVLKMIRDFCVVSNRLATACAQDMESGWKMLKRNSGTCTRSRARARFAARRSLCRDWIGLTCRAVTPGIDIFRPRLVRMWAFFCAARQYGNANDHERVVRVHPASPIQLAVVFRRCGLAAWSPPFVITWES